MGLWVAIPIHELYFTKYFGYHINMKVSSVMRYRNFFILVATFFVLCISPLADIHLESSTETKSYAHGQEHNETIFSLFIHELLFTHLQHTFDHVTLAASNQTVKKNKNLSSKKTASSFYAKAVCNSNFHTNTSYLQKGVAILHDPKGATSTFSQEYSGLSPPTLFS